MRVLLVPAPMLGLDAPAVGAVIADAWHEATGTSPLLAAAPTPERVEAFMTLDPWGRAVPVSVAVRGRTATVDTVQVAGACTRGPDDDPRAASSAGVGSALLHTLDLDVDTIVLPLDGLVCHDGGAGLVGELAGRASAAPHDLTGEDVRAARDRLGGVRLVGRTDDDIPLLGLGGASATQGPEKGMDAQTSQGAEDALGQLVDRLRRETPEPKDLLTGTVVRRDRTPGAGAGGGLGHGILLLGGTIESDAAAQARELGLGKLVLDTDLVLTCTDRFDWRVLRASVVREAAHLAAPRATPVVLVAGELEAGRREAMALGLAGLYAVVEDRRRRAGVLAEPLEALRARVKRVARTWEPRR